MEDITNSAEEGLDIEHLEVQVVKTSSFMSESDMKIELRSYSGPFKIYRRDTDRTDGTELNDDTQGMIETNAFGQMEFVGGENKTRAKYIRLSDQTELTHIEELFKTSWGLQHWPKLLISVLGGVHRFEIKPNITKHLKKEMRNLCFKVSDMSTETWFITKATDSGVTKLVAEAMQGNKYKNTFVIGITLWENLNGRKDLTQPKDRIRIPKYTIKKEQKIQSSRKKTDDEYYLNKDHTHFFLVDTGGVDCINKEAHFRQKFVKYVTEKQVQELRDQEVKFSIEDCFVPAVNLVINGGIRTLAQIKENLFPRIHSGENSLIMPVVVFAETGRVADWLTFAYENDVTRYEELKRIIQKTYPIHYIEVYDNICMCMNQKKYISIYHPYQNQSLDEVILRALIKTGRDKGDSHVSFEQLKMIMQWGREDIAEEELKKTIKDKRVEGRTIKTLLQELLLGALRNQKMNFFDMILRIAFDINEFDKQMLTNLYKHVYLQDTMFKQGNTLFTFLKPDNKANNLLHCVRMEINKLLSLKVVDYYDEETYEVDDAEKELFLWAVLCNKHKVASILWKRGDDPIAKALIARKMFNKMATRYKVHHPYFDEHVYKSLLKRGRYFEMEAMNLLEKCSMISTAQAAKLVDVSLPRWNDKSCMELAALSEFEQFIAHQRCEDITELTWRGDFALYGRYLHIKIISGIFCPPLLLLLQYKESYKHKDKFCCRSPQLHKRVFCKVRHLFDKPVAFYNAPVTKFWRNAVFYMFFLFCFALLVLNKFGKNIRFYEGAVLAFILSFIVEEIRSLFQGPGINFRQKLHAWWDDPWNKIDCLAQAFFVLAITLRILAITSTAIQKELFIYSRLAYALDFLLWTLRLLQVISLHERIGVYVVMLQRMVGDVIYFVAICSVFILGYGIARTSILYPETELNLGHFKNDIKLGQKIFLKPIFQVVGEMFLDTSVNDTEKTVFNTQLYNHASETFMLVLQFVYIMLTNILFINLLIAVFNNTYESAAMHSDRIYKWQYYRMVNDYQSGSILPAPLSILDNIFCLFKVIINKLCKPKRQQNKACKKIPMTDYFEKDTLLNSMKQFENECLSKYLIERMEYVQQVMKKKHSIFGGGGGAIQNDGGKRFQDSGPVKNYGGDAGFLLYGSDDGDDD